MPTYLECGSGCHDRRMDSTLKKQPRTKKKKKEKKERERKRGFMNYDFSLLLLASFALT